MATRFEPNHAGIAAMGRSKDMQAAMRLLAEKVRIRAEQIAPVRTGHYAFDLPNPKAPDDDGGFHVSSGVRAGKAFGRVAATAFYSRFLEFGTRYMKKQRILGRSLDALRR